MRSKKVFIIYWIITAIFAALAIIDGSAGALRVAGATEALAALGYPAYLSTILGIAKILGTAAILQNVFRVVKEWAYAGFTILLIGACASHVFSGSSFGFVILPLVMLAWVLVSYFLWRKIESE